MDITTKKQKLARFGRAMAMLLNRGMMYQKNHPMVKNSITEVLNASERLFETISPIVFILNHDQFFVDEEPLDPRISVKRIASLFEKNGIQSVSFENGLTTSELDIFIDIFSSLTTIKDVETIKKSLAAKGAYNVRVNHVVYKKVTEDDQVVSREALKNVTPDLEGDDQESRKRFMETLLESVLTEEFAKTLNIQSLIANPGVVSKNMIAADLASAESELPDGEEYDTAHDRGPSSQQESSDTAAGDDTDPALGSDTNPELGMGGGTGMGPGGAGTGTGGGTGPGSGRRGVGTGGTGSGPGMGDGTGLSGGTGGGMGGGTGTGFLGGSGTGPGTGGMGSGPGGGTGAGPGRGDGTGKDTSLGSGSGAGIGGGTGTGFLGDAGTGPGIGGGAGAGPGVGDSSVKRIGGGAVAAPGMGKSSNSGDSKIAEGAQATAATADKKYTASGSAAGHGPMLMHQLDMMHDEVEKHLQGEGEVSLEALADAIFEMKKELFEGIETQKALGVAYNNEKKIIESANKLTDKVILELIREEYRTNKKMPARRLALIITRLVPEAKDLKRLLPKIKKILVNAGMPLATYLDIVQELKVELQSDELARVLQESSDTIGVDGQDLIDEIKQNPSQAAKLIYLASEIKKGTGDDAALSDILVDYVEQMAMDAAEESPEKGGDHLKSVVSEVESTLMSQLGKMNVGSDVLLKMEDRINDRMESILDKMRVDWLKSHTAEPQKSHKFLTVLQTIEHSVGEDEELSEILKTVRAKVDEGDIDENDYSQIHMEILREKERIKSEEEKIELPDGVLKADELIFVLDKEIARANRYSAPFSALAFSFVKAKPTMKSLTKVITSEAIMAAALDKLSMTIREVDYIGQIGKNKMVALLPMLDNPDAKLALTRVMNTLHAKPLNVFGVPVQLRVAGVVSTFDSSQKLDAHAFAKQLTNQLMDMVARVKNIQVLF